MENVNLHELPRKELKQLCNEHNIRTAGVKHEDLVRLLRNKLYPPATDPARLSKARSLTGSQTGIDSQISSKNRVEPNEKTPARTTSQGRTQRSLVFGDDPSRDTALERERRESSPNPALIRKPVLTKSNSTPARRSDFLRKKVNTLSGLDKQSQEGQTLQSDGSASKGRNGIGGRRPSIRSTSIGANRPGEGLNVKVNGAQKARTDVHSEEASSPRTSEGGASVAAADSSDTGSPSFCSVSEIASEAGHHPVYEDSDFDDARSVSSEPVTRFPSQTSKLAPRTSTGSKLGRSVFSSWNSETERDSLDSPARSKKIREQDLEVTAAPGGDDIFSYFLETGDTLVDDTDGLDSFLDNHTADPEDIQSADGREVDSEKLRTPETSTEHHQEIDIVDPKESTMEDFAISNHSEATLTDDFPESLPGDRWLVDYETAPISERAGVVENIAASPPSDAEARTEILSSNRNGSFSAEKPHGVENGDKDLASQGIESPGHSLEYDPITAPVTISDSGSSSADPVADVSITSYPTAHIFDHPVEHIESAGQHQTHAIAEDPEDLPGSEVWFRDDGLSRSGKEISSETSDALSDSAHVEEEEHDSRGFEATSDEVVAGVKIPESNEDHSEMPEASTEISEHAEAGTSPAILVAEEDGTVKDSDEQERSRVVGTAPHMDSEIACSNRSSDEVVAGVKIPESNEDHSEMPEASTEISEHAEAGTSPVILVAEEDDTVKDSDEQERPRVVGTTPHMDSEIACNNSSFDEVVAGEEISESNEDHFEMPVVSTDIAEHAEAGTPRQILISEETDTAKDSSNHERLRVVLTTSDLDSETGSLGDVDDRHSVGDTSCATPDSIPDAECIPSEPVEDRGDVKWSFVSALYDDSVDHVDNTKNTDGYGVPDHLLTAAGEIGSSSLRYTVDHTDNIDDYGVSNQLLTAAGELGSGSIRCIEPLERLGVRECEVADQAGEAAIDTERPRVVDESASASLDDGNVDEGKDSISNEIARITVDHAEVEDIFPNVSNRIPVKLDPELEATSSDHDHEGTMSGSSIPLELDSSVHHESADMLNVSQPYIEPLICSIDKVDEEDLGSGAENILSANHSEDDNTSVSQIAQEEVGVSLQEEKQSLNPDEDKIVATSHPRNLQQMLTVGLKMILVIGTVTIGILKIRATSHRFWEKR